MMIIILSITHINGTKTNIKTLDEEEEFVPLEVNILFEVVDEVEDVSLYLVSAKYVDSVECGEVTGVK